MAGLVLTAHVYGGSSFDISDLRVSEWPNIIAKYSAVSKPEDTQTFQALYLSNISLLVHGPYELSIRLCGTKGAAEAFRVVKVDTSEFLGLFVSLKDSGDFKIKYTFRSARGRLGTGKGTIFHLGDNESFVHLAEPAARSKLNFLIGFLLWIEVCICVVCGLTYLPSVWLWRRRRKLVPSLSFLVHWLFIN
jgi:hypothetical protein